MHFFILLFHILQWVFKKLKENQQRAELDSWTAHSYLVTPPRPAQPRVPKRAPGPDIAALRRAGVPEIETVDALAACLGITISELHWLCDPRRFHDTAGYSTHYRVKRVRKAGGGERVLLVPRPRLKAAQRWIHQQILTRVPLHDAAHGFCPGRSILTNAMPHAGKAVLVCGDLRDFFPSIPYRRVKGIFCSLGYPRDVAKALAWLCTTWIPGSAHRMLPQGAPTSPALSNLAARVLDRRLQGLARALGFTYTRYADDCAFSGPAHDLGALLRTARKIVHRERFVFHEEKCRIHRRGARQEVTGVVVNTQPGVPRAERRRLRAILHRAQFEGIEAQNRARHPHFLACLRGKIAFIHMVNPAQAAPLLRALARLVGADGETAPAAPTLAPVQPMGAITPSPSAGYQAGPEQLPF